VEAQVLENMEAQVVEKEGSSFYNKSVLENLTENGQKRTSDYVQRISWTCASETPPSDSVGKSEY
jgi:hypothetical protein